MKLSIITVNLNNRDGLKRTIDSVVSQTFTDYEWIVIDGGSTDGSRELIEQYSDHFAYWCSEPDKGIYNAMNKGIAHAKGEWLQFLNSGDWFTSNNVLEIVFYTPIEADIIFGNVFLTNGNELTPIKYSSDLSFSTLYYQSLPHPSSFINHSLFSLKLYNEDYVIVSDWAFFLECALKKCVFAHIDVFVCYFDSTGISSNNRKMVLEEREKVIDKYVPKCIQIDIEELDKKNTAFADGQLSEINELRHKNRFFHRIVTLNLWFLRFLDNIIYHIKNKEF